MNNDLPPDYYLTNFKKFLRHVHTSYVDLLTPEELAFYEHFFQLSEDAQKLLVRMLSRKGNLFRESKLKYAEISSITQAASALVSESFIICYQQLSANDFLTLYNRTECLRIATAHGLASTQKLKALTRKELDEVLLEHFSQHNNKVMLDENVFILNTPDIFETFKLLFFGNLNQDLTEFVLSDLGIFRYEQYRIDKNTRLFKNRQQIQRHIEFSTIRQQLSELLASSHNHGADALYQCYLAIPEAIKNESSLIEKLGHLYYTIARQLERENALDTAIELYQLSSHRNARERQARVLVKLGKIDEALTLCDSMTASPRSEEESIFAKSFAFRTGKKHGFAREPEEKYHPEKIILTLTRNDSVEHAAKEYFANQGECKYVENHLFCALFGLHYWDLIFAPVRGAFTHPFQYRPLDLYSSDFLEKRRTLYNEAELRLNEPTVFRQFILDKWQEKYGLASPFVFWDFLDLPLITTALERIPTTHFHTIFHRLWSDIKANRSGFPDLILFPQEGGYELIEVKGPGDTLQKNQIRWMQHFCQQQIPHRVCHVVWE